MLLRNLSTLSVLSWFVFTVFYSLESMVARMKESETTIKDLVGVSLAYFVVHLHFCLQIASQLSELANVPPPAVGCPVPQDVVQFRTVLSKLSKDFEKAKQPSVEVYSDARLVQLDPKEMSAYMELKSTSSTKSGTTVGGGDGSEKLNGNSSNNGSGRYNQNSSGIASTTASSSSSSSRMQLEKLQEKQLNLMAVQESVDETIINERCNDIEKIHTSTVLLNEMFT